jgi:hypothetical protein
LGRTTYSKLRIALATLTVALVTVAPATSAPSVPVVTGPPDGDTVTFLPTLQWNAAAGADHYVVEIGADAGFNPALFTITTKNTRAVADKTVPNGTYWWRVQAVDSSGTPSPWSPAQSIEKLWAGHPTLNAPANGTTISYPADPLLLRWSSVPGAAKYRVYVALDPGLSSLIGNGSPVDTQALNYVPAQLLASNTYYWAVTPLDAQGNLGEQSPVRSFTWVWPSDTTPVVTDLVADTELFDPEFSWDPVPGAAHYEVEANSSSDFASGSKVCCSDKTIATTLTPLDLFSNNTYYWRVRAVNKSGNSGQWNQGPSFAKTFDNYPDLSELSIRNLHMRDAGDPGTDLDSGTAGYQTDDPILTWDPVPGAARYEVDVVPFEVVNLGDPEQCNWTAPTFRRWTVPTTSTAWTPLGGANTTAPFSPGSKSVSKDTRDVVAGESYCSRVRALSGVNANAEKIWGDYTFLGDGGSEPSFTFTGYPVGSPCQACNAGYLGHNDYLLPERGSTSRANPLFTWEPIAGKQSYWVLVAKDPAFSNIVDYAITRIPAYAVRTGSQTRTYTDELTSYYWVVLPATGTNGSGAGGNPALGAYADFQKQSTPPTLLSPAEGTVFNGPPRFQWTSIQGAKRYHLQVATEPTFSAPLADLRTTSTAHTALETYSAASTLYWRVQAEAESSADNPSTIGLTWSDTGTFEVDLPAPVIDPSNLDTPGDFLPYVSWSAVPGAVSYTLKVLEQDGDENDFSGFPSTAASWERITGVGITTLRVRADFPKSNSISTQAGPWSDPVQFVHTIHEPLNLAQDIGTRKVVLSWGAKTGVKNYKVQVSTRQDFSPAIETKTTDNPSFAPTMLSSTYTNGGTFYWRVAAVDAGNVAGDWSAVHSFSLAPITTVVTLKKFKLSSKGYLVKNRYRTVYIYVKDLSTLSPVSGAVVRASGAGVKTTSKVTGSTGVAKFYLKATKLAKVTFKVTRSGYQTAYLYKKVRAP